MSSLSFCYAQVGIGTDSPAAELHIDTSDSTVPALRLQPQTNPAGNENGQMAVIGERLYIYDEIRNKWLSPEVTGLQFNQGDGMDDQPLRFGGDLRSENGGPVMPLDGTITYVTVRSGGGLTSKTFTLSVKNGTTTQLTRTITLTAGERLRLNLNANFNAGDYINVRTDAAGGAVNDVGFVVWVKWRAQ